MHGIPRGLVRVICQAAAVSLVVVSVSASDAWAQDSRLRGPFAGLFGQRARNSQSLNVRASLFGAWQETIVREDAAQGLLDPTFDQSGAFAGVVGSLDYWFSRSAQNSSLFAGGQGWVADYSIDPKNVIYGAQASAGASQRVALTRRMALNTSLFSTYSPSFGFQQRDVLPTSFDPNSFTAGGLPVAVTPGFGLPGVSASNLQSAATAGLSYNVSKRSAVSANLAFQHVYFFDENAIENNFMQLASGVTYTHQIFRKLSAYAGYQQSRTRLSNPARWSEPAHGAVFGLDYGDALVLRLSRRTTLAFGVGLGSARGVPGSTQYRILGNAALTHMLGRTWSAQASVARGLGFVAAFRQPVLSDSATASIGGQLTTRAAWMSSTGWTRGYIGLDTGRHFDSLFAASTLSVAVARNLSAFAQYTYSRNRVTDPSGAFSILTNFDRQTASIGLSVYAPIFNSQRNR